MARFAQVLWLPSETIHRELLIVVEVLQNRPNTEYRLLILIQLPRVTRVYIMQGALISVIPI